MSAVKNQEAQSQRLSNIELLRIVAMIIIIAHHFGVHSGFSIDENLLSINSLWIRFLQMEGRIGVDIFVIITGYFLVKSKNVKTKRIIRFWLQLCFWSVSLYVVLVLIGVETFQIKTLMKNCLPIIYGKWWFASCYFMLYLLSPYISVVLRSLSKKQYLSLLIMLGIYWCVVPTLTGIFLESNDLLWFMYLFSLGGYIRLFDVRQKSTGMQLIGYSILVYLLTFIISTTCKLLSHRISVLSRFANLSGMQSIPVVIIAVLLFMGFKSLDIKYSRTINTISSATFGVYLIHDNDYVRPYIWRTVFKNAEFARSSNVILRSILEIIAVFTVCTILELIRFNLIEKNYLNAITKISDSFDMKKENLLNRLINR